MIYEIMPHAQLLKAMRAKKENTLRTGFRKS